MGSIFGGAKSAPVLTPPPLPPAVAPPPTLLGSQEVGDARRRARRAGAVSSQSQTVFTGGFGLNKPANTALKTLLGE